MKYLLGFDIGSSSIKAALIHAESGEVRSIVSAPKKEMPIASSQPGFAEQDPAMWWKYVCDCSNQIIEKHPDASENIVSIGIAYQMHGLVVIDKNGKVLRPSIIWCDSRAVDTGEALLEELEPDYFLHSHYNYPGNFTFSKLRWIQNHQPELFDQIDKIMLPGDYIAFKMSGMARTSITGLSEGIMWNFEQNELDKNLFERCSMDPKMVPEYQPTFSTQGEVTSTAAKELGIEPGVPISYRSGDQPNNAWSLHVNEPGIMAGTGGTSGVLYGISEQPVIDRSQRTNSFAHVNYTPEKPRIGTLLCINGAGILYSWIRKNITGQEQEYAELENRAATISPGSEGVFMLPFGNGAERMLQNKPIGAHLAGLDLNRHHQDHLIRAGLEGIGFAFYYGYEIMKELGMSSHLLRVGNDNLFQSTIFSECFASLSGVTIEVREATGAVGAALGAGLGSGYYKTANEALSSQEIKKTIEPNKNLSNTYEEYYHTWKEALLNKLKTL
ncbi:carbohydrate kinase [Membranicola marinus]|uniref:Carbohydrate kinase n=1 Tax=Membranihabitans marinus TaxID=1227546 RepID=A0A953HR33_9BACT|nr:FGGY family carbohydrate kinase [Membranihabitans marinus]MBY5959719.1 carbohydrate kinase [Membranihabitans marinus]